MVGHHCREYALDQVHVQAPKSNAYKDDGAVFPAARTGSAQISNRSPERRAEGSRWELLTLCDCSISNSPRSTTRRPDRQPLCWNRQLYGIGLLASIITAGELWNPG